MINVAAIVIGSWLGLLFRRGIPENITNAIMEMLGICTLIIGIQGVIAEKHILIMIITAVVGRFIGELTDWEGNINRFTAKATAHFAGSGEAAKIAKAFITSCMIMNVGAMVIVGSLDAGLRANYDMLFTKSVLDFVCGIMMAAAMGIGVMGSAGFTLLVQGGIVIFAEYIAPFMSPLVISEISCTGSLIILAMGLNMLNITKLKVLNYLPAIIIAPVLAILMEILKL